VQTLEDPQQRVGEGAQRPGAAEQLDLAQHLLALPDDQVGEVVVVAGQHGLAMGGQGRAHAALEVGVQERELAASHLLAVEGHDPLEGVPREVAGQARVEHRAEPVDQDRGVAAREHRGVGGDERVLVRGQGEQLGEAEQHRDPAVVGDQAALLRPGLGESLQVVDLGMVDPCARHEARAQVQGAGALDQRARQVPADLVPLGRVHGLGDPQPGTVEAGAQREGLVPVDPLRERRAVLRGVLDGGVPVLHHDAGGGEGETVRGVGHRAARGLIGPGAPPV